MTEFWVSHQAAVRCRTRTQTDRSSYPRSGRATTRFEKLGGGAENYNRWLVGPPTAVARLNCYLSPRFGFPTIEESAIFPAAEASRVGLGEAGRPDAAGAVGGGGAGRGEQRRQADGGSPFCRGTGNTLAGHALSLREGVCPVPRDVPRRAPLPRD